MWKSFVVYIIFDYRLYEFGNWWQFSWRISFL